MIPRVLVLYHLIRSKKRFGLGFVAAMLVVSLLGNATSFYLFDHSLQPEMTYGDALWYSIISITTIGYGDFSAKSLGARIGTLIFIILIGLSTFTVFLGMIVNWATDFVIKGQKGMGTIVASNHVLLVHFPAAARVRRLIEELRADPNHKDKPIVVVTDQIESLPFSYDNVRFVNGSPLEQETYERARIHDATMSLVLVTSYSDPNSDAVVSSVVSVIDSLKPSIHIVAECLDERHRILFQAVRCDAIVPGLKIAGNLLVQEIQDPGITQMIDVITSNLEGSTLFSTEVGEPVPQESYNDLAKGLLDRDINLLCVNRGTETLTTFKSAQPTIGDRLIYIPSERMEWPRLLKLAGG